MSQRALIVTAASPGRTGAADWRRAATLSEFYGDSGFETVGLCVRNDKAPPGGERAAALRGAFDHCAFTAPEAADDALAMIAHRYGFAVAHFAGEPARPSEHILSAVILCDKGPVSEEGAADICVSFEGADGEGGVIAAPLLRRAARLTRARIASGGRILAGCWVEDDPRAIDAAKALFQAIAVKGGGYGPNFALAGPGAALVSPPRLPNPPTIMPASVSERVFYRGVDIALFPDAPTGEAAHLPRYDVLTALEFGATPMVSDSALVGLKPHWRLPRFATLEHLAEYLFEEGKSLREGGLMAELRARADWTWSGLSGASASQRSRLIGAIRDKIAERRKG